MSVAPNPINPCSKQIKLLFVFFLSIIPSIITKEKLRAFELSEREIIDRIKLSDFSDQENHEINSTIEKLMELLPEEAKTSSQILKELKKHVDFVTIDISNPNIANNIETEILPAFPLRPKEGEPNNESIGIEIDLERLLFEDLNENRSQNQSNTTESSEQEPKRQREADIVKALASKLKKLRRALEKDPDKFVENLKKCAKTSEELKIYLKFAEIMKNLLEEIARKEREEKRKIFLFTFNSYKNLEKEIVEWGQQKIGILEYIILSIGEEDNPGDFYYEWINRYSKEAFKTLRINIKCLKELCSPTKLDSEDPDPEVLQITRRNVQFFPRIFTKFGSKFPKTKPEKNQKKKPKLSYNIYRPLLTAIRRNLIKEGILENLEINNSSNLFVKSKGRKDLFNKFEKMSTEAQEKVIDCLRELWEKPDKSLKDYLDALPKAILESIEELERCIKMKLRPLAVPIHNNEMRDLDNPIGNRYSAMEQEYIVVPINNNEMRDLDNPIGNSHSDMEEEDIVGKYLS